MPNPKSVLLIVDDEPQIQKLLTYGLAHDGFDIHVASTGEDCLRLAAAHPPACVLLDLGLPGKSGLETLRELRTFSRAPVIMLTVEDDDDTKVEALDLGADDYVTKPFSMPVLQSRIRAVMRRQERDDEPGAKIFISERIRVDFTAHKVWVSEAEVHLSVTEFELLRLFIENRGKAITHRRILGKIWGDRAGDQMHYLRVYINNLRRKIEMTPSIPKLIVTEPGVGYRFEG